ncbi:phospholipid carrier-dependent glycosyltransferase [Streptomyces sp. MUSC 14]|uniref:glycosyltransferase family 39 protein n=1 Tax=Streptomyces sp. MUSC 14 TaxID=1354889 RepID=UPI0008F59F83|nr:glycosyltransferase family 39 protein [Streptomyces sp. MUSC 14]OIK00388.1 phospholipid carrier-dependent glycosyltransferase [Streptomyces sp. MUSC 14]
MMAREQHLLLGPAAPAAAPARPCAGLHRHRRWLVPLVALLLLGQMAAAMVTTAVQQTPTIDEPVYVATATDYLHEHRIRYNPEHPPLGKLLIEAGVAVADPHYDPSYPGTQGDVGRHLLYESGNDPGRLMLWARLPVIVLTLLFGLVVFAFARDVTGRAGELAGMDGELAGTTGGSVGPASGSARGLVGSAGGLVALALYAFTPDVVAHGSLATLDMPVTGFVLTSVWLLWRARRRPGLYVPLAGLALGAAVATKMSALPAVPVLTALAAVSVAVASAGAGRRRRVLTALAAAGGMALVAVAVVWASYLAVDPRLRFSPAEPVPALHGPRGTLVGLLPLPPAYRAGMRVQFGLEDYPWQGFLFGHVYTGRRWYYLPVALLVKTPLGLLALGAAGAVAVVALRRLRAAAPYLLLPPAVLLAAAMTGSREFGTRYALCVPVFLAVTAACVPVCVSAFVPAFLPAWAPWPRRRWRWRWAAAVTAVLALWTAVSSLRTFPYYLPYANEAFGGPAHTHRLLHDSNVDWGQDLGRLADRLRRDDPGERVWLVYKGSGVPSYYGIRAADPRAVSPDRVHGLLVVSDSAVAKASGRLAELIASGHPVGNVGYSITLYRR